MRAERCHVLVVEQDDVILRMIAAVLELRHYTCDIASDDNHAVELLGRNQYSILIIDVRLTNRSGFALLAHLRMKRPELLTRVVVITADVSDNVIRALKEIDVCDVVPKPIDFDALLEAIEACLAENPPNLN